jgi:hypothetical protein
VRKARKDFLQVYVLLVDSKNGYDVRISNQLVEAVEEPKSLATAVPEQLVLGSRNSLRESEAEHSSFAFCRICRLQSSQRFRVVQCRCQEVVESMV